MAKELWDACDREGRPLGFPAVRGEPMPEGFYHLVAEIYAVTRDGRLLPYEEYKRFITTDVFTPGVRRRFLDHQEAFDRLIGAHLRK